jgi:hypothetical protein
MKYKSDHHWWMLWRFTALRTCLTWKPLGDWRCQTKKTIPLCRGMDVWCRWRIPSTLRGCSGIVDGRFPKLSRLRHRPRHHLARQRSTSILPCPVWNLGLPPSTSSCLEAHVVSLCLPIVGTPRPVQPRKWGRSNCARSDCNCHPKIVGRWTQASVLGFRSKHPAHLIRGHWDYWTSS